MLYHKYFSDKIFNVYIYIHIYIDFLPDLEYIMKNRTEQNRTEQNRTEQNSVDVLGLSVKPFFLKSDTPQCSFHFEQALQNIKKVMMTLLDERN